MKNIILTVIVVVVNGIVPNVLQLVGMGVGTLGVIMIVMKKG
jgi:hypothetical protein